VAALLAGCSGGGGGGSTSSNLPNTTNPTNKAVSTGLAISVDLGAVKAASKLRSIQQITTDVTYLDVTIDSNATQTFELTPSLSGSCSGTYPTAVTCSIAANAGSHTVTVSTNNGSSTSAIVGYSVPQTGVAVTLSTVTPLDFTLTPVATSFGGSYAGGSGAINSFPEDGSSHAQIATVDVGSLNDNAISTPIDTTNLFGTVAVSTLPSYSVTQASQSAGSYADTPYDFSYTGAQVSGDAITVQAAYTKNVSHTSATETAYNAAVGSITSATTAFTIPLTRLELPATANPGDATVNGSAFGGTNSWYYYPPNSGASLYTIDALTAQPNNDASSIVVFNGSTASTTFELDVTAINETSKAVTGGGTCDTAGTGSTPIYTINSPSGTPNGVTPIVINYPTSSGQTVPCTLIIENGTFSTLKDTVTVYPTSTGTITISPSSVHRL
jgi:hypothetical protein